MALVAPLSSLVVKRYGVVGAVQAGLLTLGLASAAIAFITAERLGFVPMIPFLLAIGAAVAAHYTAGAVGTTQTPAGRYGAGIGLFNLMRIAGTAIGPALVGTILERDANAYSAIFIDTAVVAACALGWTLFLRPRADAAQGTGA
jgi:MFS family permease